MDWDEVAECRWPLSVDHVLEATEAQTADRGVSLVADRVEHYPWVAFVDASDRVGSCRPRELLDDLHLCGAVAKVLKRTGTSHASVHPPRFCIPGILSVLPLGQRLKCRMPPGAG